MTNHPRCELPWRPAQARESAGTEFFIGGRVEAGFWISAPCVRSRLSSVMRLFAPNRSQAFDLIRRSPRE